MRSNNFSKSFGRIIFSSSDEELYKKAVEEPKMKIPRKVVTYCDEDCSDHDKSPLPNDGKDLTRRIEEPYMLSLNPVYQISVLNSSIKDASGYKTPIQVLPPYLYIQSRYVSGVYSARSIYSSRNYAEQISFPELSGSNFYMEDFRKSYLIYQLRYLEIPDEVTNNLIHYKITSLFQWYFECVADFQSRAFETKRNYLISARTAAGKSLTSNLILIYNLIRTGYKVLYIETYKATAAQRFQELTELLKGLDFSVHPYYKDAYIGIGEFDVAVCVLEKATYILRTQYDINMVILDEIHFVYQFSYNSRSRLYEELVMACLSNNIYIVALSATIPDLYLFQTWLRAEVFEYKERIVPLHLSNAKLSFNKTNYCLLIECYIKTTDIVITYYCYDLDKAKLKFEKLLHLSKMYFSSDQKQKEFTTQKFYQAVGFLKLYYRLLYLDILNENDLTIVFCSKKIECEFLACYIRASIYYSTNSDQEHSESESYLNADELSYYQRRLFWCLEYGVAFHHSELFIYDRYYIEKQARSKKLKFIFCTTTLSTGISFPVKIVFIFSFGCTKEFHSSLLDIYYMLGRAGRTTDINESFGIILSSDHSVVASSLFYDYYQLVTKKHVIMSDLVDLVIKKLVQNEFFYASSQYGRLILGLFYGQDIYYKETIKYYLQNTLLSTYLVQQGRANEIDDLIQYQLNDYINYNYIERKGLFFQLSPLGKAALFTDLEDQKMIILTRNLSYAGKYFNIKNDFYIILLVVPDGKFITNFSYSQIDYLLCFMENSNNIEIKEIFDNYIYNLLKQQKIDVIQLLQIVLKGTESTYYLELVNKLIFSLCVHYSLKLSKRLNTILTDLEIYLYIYYQVNDGMMIYLENCIYICKCFNWNSAVSIFQYYDYKLKYGINAELMYISLDIPELSVQEIQYLMSKNILNSVQVSYYFRTKETIKRFLYSMYYYSFDYKVQIDGYIENRAEDIYQSVRKIFNKEYFPFLYYLSINYDNLDYNLLINQDSMFVKYDESYYEYQYILSIRSSQLDYPVMGSIKLFYLQYLIQNNSIYSVIYMDDYLEINIENVNYINIYNLSWNINPEQYVFTRDYFRHFLLLDLDEEVLKLIYYYPKYESVIFVQYTYNKLIEKLTFYQYLLVSFVDIPLQNALQQIYSNFITIDFQSTAKLQQTLRNYLGYIYQYIDSFSKNQTQINLLSKDSVYYLIYYLYISDYQLTSKSWKSQSLTHTNKNVLMPLIFDHKAIKYIICYRSATRLLENTQLVQRSIVSYEDKSQHSQSQIKSDCFVKVLINTTQSQTGRMFYTQPSLQTIAKTTNFICDYGELPCEPFFTKGLAFKRDQIFNIFDNIQETELTKYKNQKFSYFQVSPRNQIVPRYKCKLLSIDFKQFELRIFAHIANDLSLQNQFYLSDQGKSDIFTDIAQKYRIDRSVIKQSCYSSLYGGTAYTIAFNCGFDLSKVEPVYNQLMSLFPSLQTFKMQIKEYVEAHGFVHNIFGRKVPIKMFQIKKKVMYEAGLRSATNTIVYSSASDLFKIAVTRLQKALNRNEYILITMHDEVILEVPSDIRTDRVTQLVSIFESVSEYIVVKLRCYHKLLDRWY